MAEDLTTFTEVDPNSVWAQITTRNTGTDVARQNDDSYVYKSYGVGRFGNYKCLIDIYLGAGPHGEGAHLGCFGVTDNPGSYQDMSDGQVVYFYSGNAPTNNILYLEDKVTGDFDSYPSVSDGTALYCTIERSGTIVTCKIYSDAARITLLDTLTVTCGNTRREYAMVGFSRDHPTLNAAAVDGYCENLDIQRFNLVPSASLASDILGGVWDW